MCVFVCVWISPVSPKLLALFSLHPSLDWRTTKGVRTNVSPYKFQLGIHPIKGSGGTICTDSAGFLSYSEYAFDAQRMLKNCGRLRVGAIGNLRRKGKAS